MNAIKNIVLIVLMLIGVITFLLTATDTYNGMQQDLRDFKSLDLFLWATYIFTGIALVATVLSSVVGALAKPQGMMGSAIIFGGVLVIAIIAFIMADGVAIGEIEAAESRTIDMRLYTLYAVFVLAVISIIYSGVRKFIK